MPGVQSRKVLRARSLPVSNKKQSSLRALLASVVTGLLTLGSLLGITAPALAAPGDYTIDISAPITEVPVNSRFDQIISINCPEGNCAGVTITQVLPAELRLVAVATGEGFPVREVTGGTGLGATLTYTLNDIGPSGITTFNVVLTNDQSDDTTVGPDSSWDLTIRSNGQEKPSRFGQSEQSGS